MTTDSIGARRATTTDYARFSHGPGFVGWVYEYWNTAPLGRMRAIGAGLELGVQLSGEWFQAGARHGKRLYGPGQIHRIDAGELYAHSYTSHAQRSAQVGFIVYLDEIAGLHAENEELRFSTESGLTDAELLEFCRDYRASAERRTSIADAQVQSVLLGYIRRHCDVTPLDPLLAGKRELERYFDRELMVAHIAEAARMHPVTFARRFSARYGMTPVAYRLRMRLNHAARLTWSRPKLTIAEIAAACGFNDLSFFHRRFVRHFGATPSAYRSAAQIETSHAIV